jgi:hypothetical protein
MEFAFKDEFVGSNRRARHEEGGKRPHSVAIMSGFGFSGKHAAQALCLR